LVPSALKRRVKLFHNALHKHTITISVFNKDPKRFFGETASVFGVEFTRRTGGRGHA
jgi:hypothetical protein